MAERRVQRRLAAILAADVVGYSRLMREDETGTLAQLKTLRKELLYPKVEEYGGRVVNTTGDGTLIEFPSAVDAVQHAVDVQQAMALRNRAVPEDRRIELRMGINLGDVIVDDEDIYGDGVNVASRLEGLAKPGGICLSLLVRESVRHNLDVEFTDLGEQSVKNIADPIQVFSVDLDVAKSEADATISSDALFRRPAVAVLPFQNMSDEPGQEFFVDGLTEDIITALSLWRSFPVIARNSSFTYKDRAVKVQEVGKELGVRYVLEGSVRKDGSRIRVTAQLIDARTGHHVWAERYDRDLTDIFELQDELTQRIAAIVVPELDRAEQKRLVASKPKSYDAWDFVQRGIAHIYEFNKEGNILAKEMFERAIGLDSNYSKAYGWLAHSLMRDYWLGFTDDRERTLTRLLDAGRRAVALDDTDSFAHCMLSLAYTWSGDLDLTIAESEIAVSLNPNSADSYSVLGHALAMTGNLVEGLRNSKIALQLNPRDPRGHVFIVHIALAYLIDRQYTAAAEWASKAIQRKSDFAEAHFVLAASLGHLGRSDDARRALESCRRIDLKYVEKWATTRPYIKAQYVAICLDGIRQAGWEG